MPKMDFFHFIILFFACGPLHQYIILYIEWFFSRIIKSKVHDGSLNLSSRVPDHVTTLILDSDVMYSQNAYPLNFALDVI
jgi:hypothetical protein